MSPEMVTVLIAIITATIALAGLILVTTGRLGARIAVVEVRLTGVEKETARLSGLLEGLGLTGRLPPRPHAGTGGEVTD